MQVGQYFIGPRFFNLYADMPTIPLLVEFFRISVVFPPFACNFGNSDFSFMQILLSLT